MVQPASQDPSRLTPLAELQLLDAHRGGDPTALGRLLEAYQRRIHSICYRMIRNEHEARDLTQDTMLRVIQGLDSYDGRSKLSTWVIRVTMNTCLSHLRKQKLRRHGSLDAGTESASAGPLDPRSFGELSPPGRVEQAEMKVLLGRALLCLDPDMRAVLVLRDMQELEYERIAKALEVPIGTVKSRLFRARLALRAAVEVELGRHGVHDVTDERNDE
jgi:RNA polymerase sigma-70 factor (ECF subfamily)